MQSAPTILLVDDEPAIVATYETILRQCGYEVLSASSAAAAQAELDENSFDLVLCDLILRGRESGLDVLAAARERNHNVGCILLTGYPHPELEEQARDRGARVMLKPVEVPHLLQTIQEMLLNVRASS